jgi:hypothetical protein
LCDLVARKNNKLGLSHLKNNIDLGFLIFFEPKKVFGEAPTKNMLQK